MNELVSVIVPVYNSEKYLNRCLKSICCQTYSNLEIIIIDDGSNDHSKEILDKFRKKDKRIKLFSQQNQGVSVARNRGIDMSEGKYIIFVDSDDFIEEMYCQNLVRTMQCNNIDALLCANDSTLKDNLYLFREDELEDIKLSCLSYDEKYLYNIDAPWGKIFKTEIIKRNNIYFPSKLSRSEDALFCVNFYEHSKNIAVINYNGYNHSYNDQSLCNAFNINSMNILSNIIKESRKWVYDYHPNNIKYIEAVNLRVLPGIVECENLFFLNKKNFYGLIENIKKYQEFLDDFYIKGSIKDLNYKIIGKNYKFRLLCYQNNMSKIFIFFKLIKCRFFSTMIN